MAKTYFYTLLNSALIGVIGMLMTSPLFGQEQGNGDLKLNEINILSPHAASLGKYLDNPVNMNTGIPEITFPIYQVQEGPLSLPVSVSYNASGIKVTELASSVGLGFSLQAGGVISRTIQGLPDEKISPTQHVGYYNDHGYNNYLMDDHLGTMDLHHFGIGEKDGEPDLFFFNFGGYSGKFVIREDNVPVIIPHQNIRIEPIFCKQGEGCSVLEPLRSWKLTTPDGTKYFFGMSLDDATYGAPAIERTDPKSEALGVVISKVISSWYLYRVESADGTLAIRLKYESDQYAYYTVSHGAVQLNTQVMEPQNVLVKNNVNGVRLSQIQSSQGTVSFIYSKTREDLSQYQTLMMETANVQSKALGSIQIRAASGGFCKSFDFEYDYFSAHHEGLQGPLLTRETDLRLVSHLKRLKLKSIQEKSCDQTIVNPKTEFSYFESVALPSTLSFAIDHWGYYNGQQQNKWLLPRLSTDNGVTYLEGADREARWPQMKAGMLTSIRHPTGGYTEFVFGHDEVTIHPSGAPPYPAVIGGMRIDEINSLDKAKNKVTGKKYDYPGGVMLFSIPTYIYLLRNPYLILADYRYPHSSSEGCLYRIPGVPGYYSMISTSSIHPLRTIKGSPKGYEYVKVTQADGGYSEYTYDVSGAPQLSKGVAIRAVNESECSGLEPIYPVVPENVPLRRGELLKEEHYEARPDNSARLVRAVSYDPQFEMDEAGTHGLLVSTVRFGPANTYYIPEEYQVKSGRKIKDTRLEITPDPASGVPVNLKTVTSYENPFHTFATRTQLFESLAANARPVTETMKKYVKDFAPCDKVVNPGSYTARVDAINASYQANLQKCTTEAGRRSICNLFSGCATYGYDPCGPDKITALLVDTGETILVDNPDRGMIIEAAQWCTYRAYRKEMNEYQKYYVQRLLEVRESECWNTAGPATDPVYQSLLDLNRRNEVAGEVESTQWRDGNLTGAILTQFKKTDQAILPDKVFQAEVNYVLPEFDFASATISNGQFKSDEAYNPDPEATYKYVNGRVVEVTSKKGTIKAYWWDAANKYPIVKAEGMSYSDLYFWMQNALTMGAPGSTAFEHYLRQHANGPITTYTFKDMVGVATLTDANNKTTTYEYDGLGRLKAVKDNEGNIIKHYDYQFDKTR